MNQFLRLIYFYRQQFVYPKYRTIDNNFNILKNYNICSFFGSHVITAILSFHYRGTLLILLTLLNLLFSQFILVTVTIYTIELIENSTIWGTCQGKTPNVTIYILYTTYPLKVHMRCTLHTWSHPWSRV